MLPTLRDLPLALTLVVAGGVAAISATAAAQDEGVEFFERRIRPVLVERCYECHNSSDTAEGGLALDHREALLQGGDSGPTLLPGRAAASRLLQVIRHEIEGQEMPDGGPRLTDEVIADFAKWIDMGAPDPRDQPPTADELARAVSWEATLQKRKAWWSFQPIAKPAPPPASPWSDHPVDCFVKAKLDAAGLAPAAPAEDYALLRRLTFALTGLPPTPAQMEAFVGDDAADRIARCVDRLLDSPQFGERWARHWMDWIRYAESHGSEGDPEIHNAWYYRDYLIRALNQDVPYDQLLREHIAGDLLAAPRINQELEINESLIGAAHWRMVFHGFAPTDALDERVRFTDDQINAFSKAFLGVTVSCARCHDHKFDAISQADYYAMFGILASCRPGRVVIDLPEKLNRNRAELLGLKQRLRDSLAKDWSLSVASLSARLLGDDGLWRNAEGEETLLHPWRQLKERIEKGERFADVWRELTDSWRENRRQREQHASRDYEHRWGLATSDFQDWYACGNGLTDQPTASGGFAVRPDGDDAVSHVLPAGAYSHTLSEKHAGRLTSPDFHLHDESTLWLRVMGDNAGVRYVVQDYPRDGTVYPVSQLASAWRWQKFDVGYWRGDDVHIEVTTNMDAPLLVRDGERGWFGIREAVVVKRGEESPPERSLEHLDAIYASAASVTDFPSLAAAYAAAVAQAIDAFGNATATSDQALLLDACLSEGLLPNRLDSLTHSRPLLEAYRACEADVPAPTRVPGLEETGARDQPLFVRGNHKRPGDPVPRRFLEAIDASPYDDADSGRRQLAEDLVRDDNPLTRRVIVNRLWHHLFGQGLVATPDNLGQLGSLPTHPELLDYLAARFAEQHGSLKQMIRFLVTSRTWQLDSTPSDKAREVDPDNQLWSHARVRRLEAEAIRDALLSVSGRLQPQLFGPPVGGDSPRRSVYVRVRRNQLDPFLRVFDFPEPYTATGRRDATNVPAQSLTMMNDESVRSAAEAWTDLVLADDSLRDAPSRARRMLTSALGRPPSHAEVDGALEYLESQAADPGAPSERTARQQAWTELARAIFNLTEFIHLK